MQPDGRGGFRPGVLLQGFDPGRVVHGERPSYEGGEADVRQRAFQLGSVGDQPGLVEPFEEPAHHRACERGDRRTGTAPIRETAQVSRTMSTLSVLWTTTSSEGRTPASHSRPESSSTTSASTG